MQRKLDTHEKYWIAAAADAVMSLMRGCECTHPWDKRFADLLAVDEHGTTDGKPYDEPQPEIGEGYRAATLSDAHRGDRQVWCDGFWLNANIGSIESGRVYSVPVDRIPTDEDAKQRPTVMVLDNIDGWHARQLLAVTGMGFLVASGDGFTNWKQARFPYPGELP